MPMKLLSLIAFLILFSIFSVIGFSSALHAAPQFWTSEDDTPTPPPAPGVNTFSVPSSYLTASPTPVFAPIIKAVSPTPTPVSGLKPVDPTTAALFSVVLPGSGQVYAGDPLKGVVIAALFGVGLWQTIDNLSLQSTSGGTSGELPTVSTVKNEDLGSIAGLVTLAIYGYQIQDASDTATQYNKKNYLTFNLGISPRPNARLAYMF
jgi:hypothetical protein